MEEEVKKERRNKDVDKRRQRNKAKEKREERRTKFTRKRK
jgi:hypothetical protein